MPGSPWNSNARSAPPGGRNAARPRRASPSRSRRGWIENGSAADSIGYSKQHVHQPLVPEKLHLLRQPRPARWARASANDANDLSDGSDTRASTTRGYASFTSPSYMSMLSASHRLAAVRSACIRAREVQVAGAALGHVHFTHRGSGTRSSSCSVRPSGLTKACTLTSAGISCAVHGNAVRTRRRARSSPCRPGTRSKKVFKNGRFGMSWKLRVMGYTGDDKRNICDVGSERYRAYNVSTIPAATESMRVASARHWHPARFVGAVRGNFRAWCPKSRGAVP